MLFFGKKRDAGKIVGAPHFVLFDKDGKKKLLWNANALGRFTMRLFRLFVDPISVSGQVKEGILNSLAAYGVQASLFGKWDYSLDIRNLITSAGKAGLASRLNGSGAEAVFSYLAVGTGTGAAAVGDTTLGTEIVDSGLARAAATCTRVTTSVTNDTAQLDKTWSVTGTKAVTEVGAFNASSGGVLLGRQVFSAINVVNGDSLQLIYKFQIS